MVLTRLARSTSFMTDPPYQANKDGLFKHKEKRQETSFRVLSPSGTCAYVLRSQRGSVPEQAGHICCLQPQIAGQLIKTAQGGFYIFVWNPFKQGSTRLAQQLQQSFVKVAPFVGQAQKACTLVLLVRQARQQTAGLQLIDQAHQRWSLQPHHACQLSLPYRFAQLSQIADRQNGGLGHSVTHQGLIQFTTVKARQHNHGQAKPFIKLVIHQELSTARGIALGG